MPQNSSASGWQGRRRDVPEVRHRWEQDWSEVQKREFVSPPRKLRRKLALLLLLTIGMGGAVVGALAFRPQRMPMVTICLSDYAWPLAPNAGVGEDLAGLQSLDRANLNLVDLTPGWQNRQLGLTQLDEYLDRTLSANSREPALLLYISSHGMIDGDGEPCLLLPGYDPVQSEQWLPLRTLISRLQSKLPPSTRAVLILDCAKSRSNWRIGKFGTEWTGRVRAVLEELDDSRLAVLCSTGPGESSQFSAALNATPFGYYVKLGLAGLADYRFDGEREIGGNGDGRVSLLELANFVRGGVNAWVARSRGDFQQPELIPATAADCPLTWTLNTEEITRIRNESRKSFSPAIPLAELAELWRLRDEIQSSDPLQFDPNAWSRLEHRLLRVEQLALAGSKYREPARVEADQLRGQLTRILDRIEAAPTSIIARSQFLDDDPSGILPAGDLGSIGMNEYFGIVSTEQAEELKQQFRQLVLADELSPGAGVGQAQGSRQLLESFMAQRLNGVVAAGIWPNREPASSMAALHLLGESACFPRDIRTGQCTQAGLESADQLRRQAFDRLWIRDSKYQEAATEADAAYRNVTRLAVEGETIDSVFRLHDQVWNELPYLAQWLLRWKAPIASDDGSPRQQVITDNRLRIISLINDLAELSRQLGQAPRGAAQAADLLEAKLAVEEKYQSLRNMFDSNSRLLASSDDRRLEIRSELDAALAVPLLNWETRLALLERRLEWDQRKDEEGRPEGGDGPPVDLRKLSNSLLREFELQTDLANHPLLTLLDIAVPEKDPRASDPARGSEIQREQAGQLVRDRLLDFRLESFLDEVASGQLDRADQGEPASRRSWLAARAGLARRVASLMSRLPAVDAPGDWREFELQQWLIWHSRRALADFYGYPPGPLGRELQGQPVFQQLTEKWLAYAAQRLPPGETVQAQIADVAAMNQRQVSYANGLSRLSADSEIQLDQSSTATLNINVPQNPSVQPQELSIQPGQMALALASDRDPKWGPVLSVPVPVSDSSPLRWDVSAESLGQFNRMVANFRGHEFDTPVFLKGVSGYRLVIEPSRNQQASITLFGARKGRSAILFVLDCSQSMAERIQAELVGGELTPRLTLAKGALATMLNELAARGDTRVGVSFFGHRIGWTTTEPTLPLRQDAYGGQIPDDLVPSNDVELVLPVGRFSGEQVDSVVERMETVRPWGQSPLYLALMQGLQSFEQEEQDVDPSIVVITDGLNYQFSPAGVAENSNRATLDDVMRELGDRQVPVFILGFGISDEERREASEQFYSIAERSNGGYFEVESGRELLQTLRDQLNLGQYQVLDENQNAVSDLPGQQLYRLNQSATLTEPGGFSVLFDNELVETEIEGGEKLELFVEDDGFIRSLPYEAQSPVAGRLVSDNDPRVFLTRVHRPTQTADGVAFPISFQFPEQAFTPRPQEVWIEIQPERENDQGPEPLVYTFYDRNFVPGTPVPVIRCFAPNWPAESRRARVSVWCQYSETSPLDESPLALWTANGANPTPTRAVVGIDGIDFRVEIVPNAAGTEGAVRVVETHSHLSPGLHALQTGLSGMAGIVPLRIVRQFDSQNRLAVHSFYFSQDDFDRLRNADDAKVRFTAREDLLDGAWSLPEGPITVPLVEDTGVLPLEAATDSR